MDETAQDGEFALPVGSSAGFTAAFLGRVPGVDVLGERNEVLSRLAPAHQLARRKLGLGELPLATAEQVHGNQLAVVETLEKDHSFPGVDGLITNKPEVVLGIYVADCAAVYLFEPRKRVLGLVHSGKVGTELGIVPAAVAWMQARFEADPDSMHAVISPCIRPPHYEIDFAAQIRRQLQACGVRGIDDAGICTASHPDRYYSYRREKGRTGRMLALAMIAGG